MSIYTRKITASSKLFFGFTIDIDIRYYTNNDEIINHFKNELLNVLKENNFEVLCEEFNKLNFHIHTHNFDEILMLNSTDIIYICECSCC